LKVIEAYEKHWKPEDEGISKAFDGMDQHNAWDFETQYKQILFKLKLGIKSEKTFWGQKNACHLLLFWSIDLITNTWRTYNLGFREIECGLFLKKTLPYLWLRTTAFPRACVCEILN
jgi:hypothetical protein